jgi:hypothetical protein
MPSVIMLRDRWTEQTNKILTLACREQTDIMLSVIMPIVIMLRDRWTEQTNKILTF